MKKNCTIRMLSLKMVSLKNFLFFSGLFFWILQEYIMRTKFFDFFGNGTCTIIRTVALLLLISKILLLDTKYSPKIFFLLISMCIIAVISQFSSNSESSNTMINIFIICIATRDIDFSKICCFIFWISGSAWVFTVLSSYLGIVNNDFIQEPLRVRYYLGFDYVSFPSIYLVNIIFSGFYAYTKRKGRSVPWIWIIVSVMLNFWVYEKTVTRLAFIIVLLFLFLYVLVEKFKINLLKNNRVVCLVSTLLYPLAGVLTYVVSSLYNALDVRWLALNEFFNNRLLMNKIGIEKFGITLFGQNIISNTNTQSGEYFFIDSGYMSLLLRNGIVLFVFVLFIYMFLLRNSIKTNNTVLAIWLICICIYCVINGNLLSPVTNCSLLAVWQLREEVMDAKRKITTRIHFGGE